MTKIALSKIQYNLQNPRFDKTKVSAREALVSLANAETIELARHIGKRGLNPTKKMAVFKAEGKYITAEGNRRLAAVKLLVNPALLDSLNIAKPIKNELKRAAPAILASLKSIDCAVFDSEHEASEWVRLEHTGKNAGVGTVQWNREQQQRYDNKFFKAKSPELQALDFMRRLFADDDEITPLLAQPAMTPFERLLNDPDVRSFLGLQLKDKLLYADIPEDELKKPLRKVILDITNPDPVKRVTTRTLNLKSDRSKYLHTFTKPHIPNPKTKIEPWPLDTDPIDGENTASASLQSSSAKTKSVPSSVTRTKLLDPTCILHIEGHRRINDLYHVLRELDVDRHANVVSVIARLFMEMTANHYLMTNMGKTEQELADSGRYKLSAKFDHVVSHLKQAGKINGNQEQAVNRELGNAHSAFHPNSLNAFVHNPNLNPSANDLKRGWNNVEPMVVAIWT